MKNNCFHDIEWFKLQNKWMIIRLCEKCLLPLYKTGNRLFFQIVQFDHSLDIYIYLFIYIINQIHIKAYILFSALARLFLIVHSAKIEIIIHKNWLLGRVVYTLRNSCSYQEVSNSFVFRFRFKSIRVMVSLTS